MGLVRAFSAGVFFLCGGQDGGMPHEMYLGDKIGALESDAHKNGRINWYLDYFQHSGKVQAATIHGREETLKEIVMK